MSIEVEHPELVTSHQTPLVDVTLITYNHEKFVAQAIESVLSQQTDFKFRLLIGDDCSIDNTQSIIRSYAENHPAHISVMLDSTHRGLKSRERVGVKALSASTAKYVAMLDGDDFWIDAHKLQKQVDFLEEHADFAICFHNARMVFQDSDREPANLLPPNYREVSTLEHLFASNFIPTASVMLRRAMLSELPEWFFTLEISDWPLHILNAQHGKIGYLNEVMANYRVHDRGAWSSGNVICRGLEVIRMLDLVDAHFGSRFHAQISAAKREWYYELAETAYQEGKLDDCRSYLREHLALGGWRGGRRTLSIFLRARQPAIYKALRSVRGYVRPQTDTRTTKPARRVKA